jgi:hypothetical protein
MREEETQESHPRLRGEKPCQHSGSPFVEVYTTTVLALSTPFSKKIHTMASSEKKLKRHEQPASLMVGWVHGSP